MEVRKPNPVIGKYDIFSISKNLKNFKSTNIFDKNESLVNFRNTLEAKG